MVQDRRVRGRKAPVRGYEGRGDRGDKNRLLRYLFSYLKKADQKKVPDEYKRSAAFGDRRGSFSGKSERSAIALAR